MAIQAKRHRKADKAEAKANSAKAPVPATVPKSNLQNVGTRPSKDRANRLMSQAQSLSKTIKVRTSPRAVMPKFDNGPISASAAMDSMLTRSVKRLNKVSPSRSSKYKKGGKSTARGRKS